MLTVMCILMTLQCLVNLTQILGNGPKLQVEFVAYKLYFHLILLYSTLLYSTLLCSALLCSALLCSALLRSTLLYFTLLYSTPLHSTPPLYFTFDHALSFHPSRRFSSPRFHLFFPSFISHFFSSLSIFFHPSHFLSFLDLPCPALPFLSYHFFFINSIPFLFYYPDVVTPKKQAKDTTVIIVAGVVAPLVILVGLAIALRCWIIGARRGGAAFETNGQDEDFFFHY